MTLDRRRHDGATTHRVDAVPHARTAGAPEATAAPVTEPARRSARAVVAGVGVAGGLLTVAVLVREQWSPLVDLDQRTVVTATSFALSSGELVDVLLWWQWAFAAPRLIVPVVALCLVFWWRTGRTTRTWWAIGTVLAAWAFSNVAKELVQRARPVLDEPVEHALGYSFPSGHATNAAAMTTAVVILLWPVLRRRWQKVTAVSAAVALTVLTAVDRVMLGVHFPTDVTAGALLGAGFVVASYLGFRGRLHRSTHKEAR